MLLTENGEKIYCIHAGKLFAAASARSLKDHPRNIPTTPPTAELSAGRSMSWCSLRTDTDAEERKT